MDYGFGKTYTIPAAFTALNGCLQSYTLTAGVELEGAENQANLLKVLEILRTYGAQPVITKVKGATVEFALEQANVFGDAAKTQVSSKDLIADAEKCIEKIFGEAKAVDGETKLFKSVKVQVAF